MSELVRFGVAMDRSLLTAFDARIASRGYENRSEALRDLIRADLTRAATDAGVRVAASLTIAFDPRAREVGLVLLDLTSGTDPCVLTSVAVPLDPGRTMMIFALRGRASELTSVAARVAGLRGVLSCELTIAAAAEGSAAHAGSAT